MGDLIGRQTDVRRFGGAASGKARLIGQPLQYLVGRSYKDDRFNHLVGTSCGHSGEIPSGMCLLNGARFLSETDIIEIGIIMRGLRVESHGRAGVRSEEHTSELQSLMRISYAVFCLKKKTNTTHKT